MLALDEQRRVCAFPIFTSDTGLLHSSERGKLKTPADLGINRSREYRMSRKEKETAGENGIYADAEESGRVRSSVW